MLGNTSLPILKSVEDFPDESRSVDSFRKRKLKLLQDGRLLLVLRYPRVSSLIRRAILGELISLNEPGKPGYFDAIHITSQLNRFSRYEFSSEKLKSKTCNFGSYLDELEEDGANTFNSSEFCQVLRRFTYPGGHFKIALNWRFTSRCFFGSSLPGEEIKTIERSCNNVWLTMQNIICDQEMNSARVAAVMRVSPKWLAQDRAATMNGLSGMTMSIEGTWDASKGQLCMVGCPGIANSGLEGCDSRISLYFPQSFSIRQRSIIIGRISSIKSNSYEPLLFDSEVRRSDLENDYDQYFRSYISYNYPKIELAGAIKGRNRLPRLVTIIKQLFLSYPDGSSLLTRFKSEIRRISYDLSFSCYGVPLPFYKNYTPVTFMILDVLTLGPIISGDNLWLYWNWNSSKYEVNMSKSEVLNISLSLTFTEGPIKYEEITYKNISTLFLEGLYHVAIGEMHLIG
ncbi:OLC1v1037197C1 [Oldenlandia corymbosa var. corymbosa]|uniref:OLC1v1037197C1 n=1 Tax=Oldenlandia corymbosa var. corymbosa TaxID=529605 RepID=A0AAV1CX70_OLDCO|nr:OLC1v1037197C1 [Oldenlandia corymbosa var. corymbosa]